MAKKKTRDRILDTTISIIGKEGPSKITVRRISSQAKVNVAAINYYFGSKEDLIEEVFKKLSEKLDSQFDVLFQEDLECNKRLHEFCFGIMEFMIDFPGLINYMFSTSLQKNGNKHTLFHNEASRQERVFKLLAHCTGTSDPTILSMKSGILYSSILHPIVSQQHKSSGNSGVDFHNPEFRRNYIKLLVDGVLKAS